MASLSINGNMKVKTLKTQFKEEFGLSIRIYDGKSFADDNATLASIRKGDAKGGKFSARRNTKVGSFEDKMMNMFGIKVQIAGSDDSYLCSDNLTLAGAQEEDKKKVVRKEKKLEQVTSLPKNEDFNEAESIDVTLSGKEMTLYFATAKKSDVDTQDKLATFIEDFVTNGAENNRCSYMVSIDINSFVTADGEDLNYEITRLGNLVEKPADDEIVFYYQYAYEEATWIVSLPDVSNTVVFNTKSYSNQDIIIDFKQGDSELSAYGNDASEMSSFEIGFIDFRDNGAYCAGSDLEDNMEYYGEVESYDVLAEQLFEIMQDREIL